MFKRVLLLCIILNLIWIPSAFGKAQFPFPMDGVYPYPVGPPIRSSFPYQQQIYHSPFMPIQSRPLIQGSGQQHIILLPDSFAGYPTSDMRIRPSIQSPNIFVPNFPNRVLSQGQMPFSPLYPFLINPVLQESSGGFDRPAQHLENLLKQHLANSRTNQNRTCSYFSSAGVCQNHAVCSANGGRPTTYCRDVTKFCCIYRWTCDLMTEQKIGYFRNPDYPLSSQLTTSCGITVRKLNPDICTIRVEPLKADLPASIGFCDGLSFNADGVPGKDYEPLCGDLAGKTYDVDISSSNTITLRVNTNSPVRLVWHIKVSQITCEEGSSSPWPQVGGIIGIEPPPQQSPPEISIGPILDVAPPGTHAQEVAPPGFSSSASALNVCGIAHRRSGFNVRDRGPFSPTAASFIRLQQFLQGFGSQGLFPSRDDDEDCEEERFGGRCTLHASRQNPLLQTLEWDVPSVNDSILRKYAGNPKPVAGKITYGKITEPHSHPWNIAMYNNGRFHCGATLISDRHVLTAAHCVIKNKRRPEKLKLSIGDWDINSNTDGTSVNGEIEKIVTHPGYSTHTLKYDLAVLTLKEKVPFSDTIVPICLPSHDMDIEGKLISVSGWGRDEKNRLQSQLMTHTAAVVSNTLCNERWEQKGAPAGIIANTMLCMDPQEGDSCKGDSGGPAILEYPPNSNKFIQVGIVSFGSASCLDKNLPGVYTKVSAVTEWIKTEISS